MKLFKFTLSLLFLFTHLFSRDFPKTYLYSAIDYLKKNKGKVIVELGTMRAPMNHDIDTSICAYCADGHSTYIWARTNLEVYSVDISDVATKLAQQYCKDFKNTHIITGDGIEFLKKFDKQIDLLFLDAWDVIPQIPFAEKHLEAYRAAKDKLKLTSLILIDDTDIENNGKGKLLIPEAIKDGFKIIFSGRQTLLSRQ